MESFCLNLLCGKELSYPTHLPDASFLFKDTHLGHHCRFILTQSLIERLPLCHRIDRCFIRGCSKQLHVLLLLGSHVIDVPQVGIERCLRTEIPQNNRDEQDTHVAYCST